MSSFANNRKKIRKNNKQHRNTKQNILIYAHYYYPDVASTGQILKELAEGMLEEFNVTVICVVPSYTGKVASEYKKQKYYKEEINGVHVLRVRVPEFSKTNKVSRVKNIIAYFFRAVVATFKVGKQDYVYTISQPPVLGGIIGVCGKWIKHAKFIYNIQDFNPEQTIAVGYSKNRFILGAMMRFDKFTCKRANKVIVVGRDMLETLKLRFSKKNGSSDRIPECTFINNWIDEEGIYPLSKHNEKVVAFKQRYGLDGKFIIMYSGNIGLYYDLANLMRIIKKFRYEKDVVFAFVGAGTVKDTLVHYKEKHDLGNVVFIPYQDKEDLIYSLNAGDVHWVVNAKGIKGVSVPSKLYGVMAAGKPVLGVLEKGSEARLIIEETSCGYVVEPGDYEGVENMIRSYIDGRENLGYMGTSGREYLIKNLTKDVSVNKYIKEIQSC
jgi:glycosyltransferase involved in cell wall biosynthesis